VLGNQSSSQTLATITIDRSPPQFTEQPTTTPDLDSAKIHFATAEKTTHTITLTPQQSDADIIKRTTSSLTFSHTVSVSGLTPDTEYICEIVVIDSGGNTSTFSTRFRTKSLFSLGLTVIKEDPIKSQSGVWEGQLLVEPGIVGDKQAVLLLIHPIIVTWTIGRPPPGLTRGSTVRLFAGLNTKGSQLLAHNSGAIVTASSASPPSVQIITSPSQLESEWKWVQVQGVITHRTKTKWTVLVGDTEVPIEWATENPDGYNKDDTVMVVGFYYLDEDGPHIAGFSAELLSSGLVVSSTPTKVDSSIASPPAQASLASIPASATIETPAQTMSKTVATVADKTGKSWYAVYLLLSGALIYGIFFYGGTKS
jgi:hypothetical protein